MSQPLVSIILLNWNGLEDTKLCLDNIKAQTYKKFETIVVDNGSNDGSVDYLKQRDDINLVLNKKNRGFTGGHIDGLKDASGEFILLLNNDAVMKPDLIEKAVNSFNNESIAVVGGRAYKWNEENPLFNEGNEFYSYQFVNPFSAEAIFYQKDYGVSEEVNNVSGSCVMIRKSVIDKLGYLEDRFFAYYEECDLFARIKRAGYKVIYNPEIAIWHKIGASSNRKSSSFMFYMLFRNRFYFAVRNFQKGYLRKFLLNYTRLGIKSSLKLLFKRGDQVYNKAFSKAFFHNIFYAYKSFYERRRLAKQLGPSRYNDLILREQENVSHIIATSSMKELETLIEFSGSLRPSHELIIVSKKTYTKPLPNNVRLCVDRGYFDTPTENYGAITARYDWLAFTDIASFKDKNYTLSIDVAISDLIGRGKKVAIFSENDKVNTNNDSYTYSLPLVTRREVFLEFHGLRKSTPGLFPFIWYAFEKKYSLTVNQFVSSIIKVLIPTDYIEQLRQITRQQNAFNKAKRARFYERIFNRYYRLQQFRSILLWLFSFRISPRLKLARIKNLLLFSITLRRQNLATEIKHIRNEVLRSHGILQVLASQQTEAKKNFKKLSKNPTDSPVFIICRDRVTPLKQLVSWLESAGLKKIVFIDNDSLYPELVKYYDSTPYQVLKMHRNPGHTVAWNQSIIPILVPAQYYILTDPDVIPATNDPKLLEILFSTHRTYKDYMKVGLGLKIDDLPDHFSLKNEVVQWESQFWKVQLEKNIYEAGVDTTFALYKPFTYTYILHPSIRLGEPYTARHLPWYLNDKKLDTEDIFYRIHADQSVNSWNSGSLPERYVKELEKQNKSR